jgi:predicted DsbA family dithiol-disulfide isomerase
MKVERWTDVVCPFCYIGKRKFEKALEGFDEKEKVEIVWRSFQLDPDMKPVPGQSVHENLARRKGVSLEEGKRMYEQMTGIAKEVGLEYNFDEAIASNTLDAHRLLHLAKSKGLQNEMKERLFRAYYTEGANIGDIDSLVRLATEVGLDADEARTTLETDAYKNDVAEDLDVARQIGARGVPFFVFNEKYAVSGAQPTEVFSEVLGRVWEEENPVTIEEENADGFCTPDGICK